MTNCPPNTGRSRYAEYSDTEVTGLKLLVSRTGRKWFYARLSVANVKHTYRLGEYPALTLSDARQRVMQLRLNGVEAKPLMPTFSAFAHSDYLPYAKAHKRSVAGDMSKLRLHLLPRFGHLPLDAIRFRVIQSYHAQIKTSHCAATANRHLSLLSKMFSCAVQWELLTHNPCKGIAKFTENNGGQRFLTVDEIRRLFGDRTDLTVMALKCLLLTGMRKNEVLRGQWQHVDLERGMWFVPHTKNGKSHTVILNDEAKALLSDLPKTSIWVFPSRDPNKPLVEIRRCLQQLAKEAGIPPLRVHDLRHSFASLCAQSGVPLLQIKSLLNHASLTTTQRYAHLTNNDLLLATQTVSHAVAKALE